MNRVEQFVARGGRIFHRREDHGDRIVTIAYVRDEKTNTIKYGATIYRRYSDQWAEPVVPWNRRLHNSTAVERCLENGVVIADADFEHVSAREALIRDSMFKLGCEKQVFRANRSNT